MLFGVGSTPFCLSPGATTSACGLSGSATYQNQGRDPRGRFTKTYPIEPTLGAASRASGQYDDCQLVQSPQGQRQDAQGYGIRCGGDDGYDKQDRHNRVATKLPEGGRTQPSGRGLEHVDTMGAQMPRNKSNHPPTPRTLGARRGCPWWRQPPSPVCPALFRRHRGLISSVNSLHLRAALECLEVVVEAADKFVSLQY